MEFSITTLYVAYHILDPCSHLLRRTHRYFNKTKQSFDSPAPAPRLPNATLPDGISLSDLAGTFSNRAYENYTLCPFNFPHLKGHQDAHDTSTSYSHAVSSSKRYCHDLLARAGTILPGILNSTSAPSFLIEINRTFISHLLLSHREGLIFDVVRLKALAPVVGTPEYQRGEWAVSRSEDGPVEKRQTAEFAISRTFSAARTTDSVVDIEEVDQDQVVVEGLGFRDGFWGAGPGVGDEGKLRMDKNVKERSEVWFEKL